MTDEEMFDHALLTAIKRICWWYGEIQACGISDDDLLERIRKEDSWNSGGGPGMFWYAAQGGKTPRVWISKDNPPARRGKPTYSGSKLVSIIRERLKIPYSNKILQMCLFDEVKL